MSVPTPPKCPHCRFLLSLFPDFESMKEDMMTDTDYHIYSEMFLYLHNGNEFCDVGIKLSEGKR